jgi:hypothetical protein
VTPTYSTSFIRESVQLVNAYVIGTLELTPYSTLTSQERYSFFPKGSPADWIAAALDQYCMDMNLLESRGNE